MSVRAQIVATALPWLGTPYHHAACIKGVGVDCAQLLVGVFVHTCALVDPFEIDEYPRDWMCHRSEERFLQYVADRATEVSEPKPGDIVLYRVGRCFAHAAIVIDWPTVIHADSRDRIVTLADGTQGRLAERERRYFSIVGDTA